LRTETETIADASLSRDLLPGMRPRDGTDPDHLKRRADGAGTGLLDAATFRA